MGADVQHPCAAGGAQLVKTKLPWAWPSQDMYMVGANWNNMPVIAFCNGMAVAPLENAKGPLYCCDIVHVHAKEQHAPQRSSNSMSMLTASSAEHAAGALSPPNLL